MQARDSAARRGAARGGLAALVFAIWLAALLSASPAQAQFPAPLPEPNLDLAGPPSLVAAVRLADGRLVVGGHFVRASGVDRPYLVRLLADGTVDTTWNPAPNGAVTAVWLDPLGRLYVSGQFTQIGGIARTRMARFDATGAIDPGFTVSLSAGANAISAGLAGEVCFGGTFTTVNGVARNRLACVSTVDGALHAFDPNLDAAVTALHTDGNLLYVGGYFTMIGTTARRFLARIPLTGSAPDAWNPNPTDTVHRIVGGGAGFVYAIGTYSTIAGATRRGVARFNTASGALDAWTTGNSPNNVFLYGGDANGAGGVFVVGSFGDIGGTPRANVAQIGSSGALVAGWQPPFTLTYVTDVVAEPNGDAIVLGPFAIAGGGEHLGIARVFANGTVDPQFNAALEVPASAFAIARVPGEGSLIVGGNFVRADGLIRRHVLKVRPDGSIDPNWTPSTDAPVRAIQVDALGRVYVAGEFTTINGAARNHLARVLNTPDGALDPTWIPATQQPYRLLLRPEGLYVNASAGGQNGIVRLATGASATLDASWVPAPNGSVGDLVATLDGALVLSGTFSTIGGLPRTGLAKVSTGATAVVDPLWAPQVTATTNNLVLAEWDNSVYLSGDFSAIDGVPRARLAKVSAVGAGALDLGWAPSLTASEGAALALATDEDHLYVAGNAGGGFFRPFLARYDHALGWRDTTWRPQPDGGLFDALPDGDRVCVVGFTLQRIGGAARSGFACLPKAGVDALFAHSFDGEDP